MIGDIEILGYLRCPAYRETKAEDADNRNKTIDLIRLAVLAKDCVDSSKMNKVIVFQVIGELAACIRYDYF